MLKHLVKVASNALTDPWVQGIIGLMLLARATDGMTRQLTELQGAIQETHQFASKVHMDWMEGQRRAPKPSPDSSKVEPVNVTEYSSHDAHSE